MTKLCFQMKFLTTLLRKTFQFGGVTFKFSDKIFIDKIDTWIFPKYPSKTLIIPIKKISVNVLKFFIFKNYKQLCENNCYFGTWLNLKNNCVYLDINTSFVNKNLAIKIAKKISNTEKRNIVAIYNPKKNSTIYL